METSCRRPPKARKGAYAKAVEWYLVEKLTDVSFRVGISRYSIAEFSSMLAPGTLIEIAKPPSTAEEEGSLRPMQMAGEPLAAISEELNRIEGAVRHKLKKLDLGVVKTAKDKPKVSTGLPTRKTTSTSCSIPEKKPPKYLLSSIDHGKLFMRNCSGFTDNERDWP